MRALLLIVLASASAAAQPVAHHGTLATSDERLPDPDDPDWTTPVDRYTVEVEAGQTLVASLMSEDAMALYPRLLLVSPSGATAEHDDRPDVARHALTQVDGAEGGTWEVLVTCVDACDGASYTLELTVLDGPPARDVFAAAAAGDLAAIRAALAEDAYVTASTDGTYRTPLMHAAEHGHVDVMRALLDAGAEVDARAFSPNDFAYDQTMDTALHDAARGGHADAVALLLAAGADPNATNADAATPLHRAVYAASPAVVRLLLDAGADPSIEAEFGGLAADLAAERRDRESADPVTDDERARLAEIVDLLTP